MLRFGGEGEEGALGGLIRAFAGPQARRRWGQPRGPALRTDSGISNCLSLLQMPIDAIYCFVNTDALQSMYRSTARKTDVTCR